MKKFFKNIELIIFPKYVFVYEILANRVGAPVGKYIVDHENHFHWLGFLIWYKGRRWYALKKWEYKLIYRVKIKRYK